MRKGEIVVLACRLFSLYIVYQALVTVGFLGAGFAMPFKDPESWVSVLFIAVLPLILLSGLAWFLWFNARWVAARIVSATRGFTDDPAPTSSEIHAIALSVLGTAVLVHAIPAWSEWGIWIIYSRELRYADMVEQVLQRPNSLVRFVSLTLKTILGLVLCFGSRWFVALIKRVREAGARRRERILDDVE